MGPRDGGQFSEEKMFYLCWECYNGTVVGCTACSLVTYRPSHLISGIFRNCPCKAKKSKEGITEGTRTLR